MWRRIRIVSDSCEHSDEPSGSAKRWNILNHWASEVLCSVLSESRKSCLRYSRKQPPNVSTNTAEICYCYGEIS